MTPARLVPALIALAVILPACSRAAKPSPTRTPATSVTSPGTPSGGTSSGGTTSRSPSGRGVVERVPSPAATAKPGITVPRSGRYTYDVIEEGNDGVTPTRAEYVQFADIDPPVTRDDGVSVEIRTSNSRSEQIAGEVFLFRAQQIDMLFADGCVLDEPATHYRLPLRVGASWPSPHSCEGESDTATTEVLEERTVLVGGVRVETFVVRRTATLGVNRYTKTQWYAPRYELVVRSSFTDTVSGRPHSIAQSLRSLFPAKKI